MPRAGRLGAGRVHSVGARGAQAMTDLGEAPVSCKHGVDNTGWARHCIGWGVRRGAESAAGEMKRRRHRPGMPHERTRTNG